MIETATTPMLGLLFWRGWLTLLELLDEIE